MLGKIDASLNKMIDNVEWGEYRLGDLFEIISTPSFNTDKLVDGNEFDYVTRTSINQGVLQQTGFVNTQNINESGVWSLGLLQMDFFYRNKRWYAGQFVRKIVPKIEIPRKAVLYFSTVLNKQKQKLLSVLVRNVDKTFNETSVSLPVKENGKIDFDFMEKFIGKIENEHIANLKEYLLVEELKDYNLTNEEQEFIGNINGSFQNINLLLNNKLKQAEWCEYRMGDLFDRVKTNKLPYKAKELPNNPTGEYVLPCLTSSFMNQGLNYYVPKGNATILKNVISIPSNSDVYRAYYQSRDFTVLSDAYAICWKNKDLKITPNQYLFMVLCINKVTDLSIYSYKNKLGGWNVVKNKYILLPQKNGKIDFDFMEKIIRISKKLAIKDVVIYSEKKNEEHRIV